MISMNCRILFLPLTKKTGKSFWNFVEGVGKRSVWSLYHRTYSSCLSLWIIGPNTCPGKQWVPGKQGSALRMRRWSPARPTEDFLKAKGSDLHLHGGKSPWQNLESKTGNMKIKELCACSGVRGFSSWQEPVKQKNLPLQ